MKKLIALLLALVMVIGLVACGNSDEPAADAPAADAPAADEPAADEPAADEPAAEEPALSGEIVFATTFNNVADTTIKALAEEFMAENPGTTITIQAIGNAEQELPVMMAGNAMPDIAPMLKTLSTSEYADYFLPIDDLYTPEELNGYDYGVGDDGHLYGLNSASQYFGIIYNKAVFEEAGVTEIPLTMEDFMAACEKIKAIGAVPMASNFKDAWPLASLLNGMADAYDASSNVWNDAAGTDALITSGGGVEYILNFIDEMNQNGYLEADLFSTNWESSKVDMAAGKIAMMPLASWLPAQIVDLGAERDDMGMFPYPGTSSLISTGDWKYGVSKNSENPELAKAFLKWIWDEGRFAEATGLDCPLTSYSSDEKPWLDELLSYNYAIVTKADNSDAVKGAITSAEYDFAQTMIQDYLVAEDKAAFIEEINERWASVQ